MCREHFTWRKSAGSFGEIWDAVIPRRFWEVLGYISTSTIGDEIGCREKKWMFELIVWS